MWVPTTPRMTTFKFATCVFQSPLAVDARPLSSFGQDEGRRRQKRFAPLFLEGPIRLLNQSHTIKALSKWDHLLEHRGLKSAELNPMTPIENRNDDLFNWSCPQMDRSWRVPRSKAHKLRRGPHVAETKHPQQVLGRSSASALQSMRLAREGLSSLFCQQARWPLSPERQNGAREAHNNNLFLPIIKQFLSVRFLSRVKRSKKVRSSLILILMP